MRFQETEFKSVYTTQIHDKPAVVAMTQRDRAKADFVNNSVTVSPNKIRSAKRLADESGAALWVAVSVSVRGEWKQSFALPYDEFKKVKQGQSDFPLGDKAREEMAKGGVAVVGFKPQIVAAPVTPVAKAPKAKAPAKISKKVQREAEEAARNKAHVDKAFGGPVA